MVLSVSPIGSNPLQLGLAGDGGGAVSRLSVSPIGSNPLQHRQSPRPTPGGVGSFSIPNRIEPSATNFSTAARSRGILFQYPQSDRTLCNSLAARLTMRSHSFSIPNRIEPSATTATKAIIPVHFGLSVSPIGSNPLQPGIPPGFNCLLVPFSIPNRGKDSGYAFRNQVVTTSEPACFWACQIVTGF